MAGLGSFWLPICSLWPRRGPALHMRTSTPGLLGHQNLPGDCSEVWRTGSHLLRMTAIAGLNNPRVSNSGLGCTDSKHWDAFQSLRPTMFSTQAEVQTSTSWQRVQHAMASLNRKWIKKANSLLARRSQWPQGLPKVTPTHVNTFHCFSLHLHIYKIS